MKKVLITGGSGTVGEAFIKENINKYKIISLSRNEKAQISLKRNYPEVEIIFGSVDKEIELKNAVRSSSPDIIIHAAALKHVDTAEKQPSLAIKSNIIGSLNIIEASILNNVPLTVGISTDKACSPNNVYGQTKYLMERLFVEHDSLKNRFICCRFGNVAWSNGSVLPFWIKLAKENKIIPVTSKNMTRLIFTAKEAAILINKAISLSGKEKKYFTLSKKMKKVNMLKMAKIISEKISIVGLRPGEIESEDLISQSEAYYTQEIENGYLLISPLKKSTKNNIKNALSSSNAKEMSIKEMKNLLLNVDIEGDKRALEKNMY